MLINIPKSEKLLDGPKPNKSDMSARLKEFHERMAPNSVAIIVSHPERTRSHDTEFAYRQNSDMLFFNAFPEPHSALVLCKLKGKRRRSMLMFVQPKDRAREIWTGIRIGPEGAREEFLADEAFTNDQFETHLKDLVQQAETIYYRFGINEEFDDQFRRVWMPFQKPLQNPGDIVHELRLFKSDKELELMRHACAISAEAHSTGMRCTRPGMKEYQLQAAMEFMFKWHGAADNAYGSIVAGGNNAVVLHYHANNATLESGQLVLVDAACEYQGYASDITRTWPVSGKFSPAQRELYQLVLDSQLAAIAAVRPGVPLANIHQTACRVLRNGLKKLGILPKEDTVHAARKRAAAARAAAKAAAKVAATATEAKASETKVEGKPADEPKPLTLTDFYMHGTSHWMGLDVHDVGRYMTGDGTRTDKGVGKRRKLEVGMVFTVEPGLYFDANDQRVPERFRGIGIRIEDDVVVTAKGCEVLTAGVVKEVADVEALMASGRNSD